MEAVLPASHQTVHIWSRFSVFGVFNLPHQVFLLFSAQMWRSKAGAAAAAACEQLVYGITALKLPPPVIRRWIKPLVGDRIYYTAVLGVLFLCL